MKLISVQHPITPVGRLIYAALCRFMAIRMRALGDHASADLNDWMASNYERYQA